MDLNLIALNNIKVLAHFNNETNIIYCKDKIKGLTTAGLWEWFWRIALFGIGILTYRSKRVEFITRNEFDNIKKFEELLAK